MYPAPLDNTDEGRTKMALPKLTQVQLAEEIADKAGTSRSDAKRFLEALEAVVAENVQACYRVTVAGVTIGPALKAATKKRRGRNPQTGEEVEVPAKPASVRVALRASKKLKEQVPSTRTLKNAL